MAKFPIDAPLDRVLAAMARLGFHVPIGQSRRLGPTK